MAIPVLDKRHLKEYIIFGLMAALLYIIPVIIFLFKNNYGNLYYLFMGSCLFMVPIFFYCYKLIYARYDRKRAVSMLMAGHLATIAGVIMACLLAFGAMMFFNPDLFSKVPQSQVLPGAAPQDQANTPAYLLMMILATAIIGNFATGSFISVIVSYAGKTDQTKDKPADIGPQRTRPH